MLGSFLISSMPLLVSIADIAIPCTLLSTFTCCESCFSFRIDWSSYNFRSSLVDIPFVSLVRSVVAICKCPILHLSVQSLLLPGVLSLRPSALFCCFLNFLLASCSKSLLFVRDTEPLPWALPWYHCDIGDCKHGVLVSQS
jgi:hypothetical protein